VHTASAALFQEVRPEVRCLYCGIRLKIAEGAKVIQHCPECSMRIEYESRHSFALSSRAEDRDKGARVVKERTRAAFASMKNA
jgi:DNA-directed RNA polymerase subunit RPC12/RpoP